MASVQSLVGTRGFGQQYCERGDVVVPFDQGRQGAESIQHDVEQCPDLVAYGAAVIVDQQVT
jgi:hypothetical protein